MRRYFIDVCVVVTIQLKNSKEWAFKCTIERNCHNLMWFLRQVNIATEKWFLYNGNDDDAKIAIVFHDNSHMSEFIAREKTPKIDVAKELCRMRATINFMRQWSMRAMSWFKIKELWYNIACTAQTPKKMKRICAVLNRFNDVKILMRITSFFVHQRKRSQKGWARDKQQYY